MILPGWRVRRALDDDEPLDPDDVRLLLAYAQSLQDQNKKLMDVIREVGDAVETVR